MIRLPMIKNKERGFTIVEAVIAMTAISVIGVSIVAFMNPAMNLMARRHFNEGPAREGRLAIMRMSRDISQLRNAASVQTASSTQFRFINVDNQSITFTSSANTLTRNGVALAKHVSSLQFVYWDDTNTQIVTPVLLPETNIERVEVLLTVSSGGFTSTSRTQVYPRNIANSG